MNGRKIVIVVAIILGFQTGIIAQGIVFFKGTYSEALAKAKAENKTLFIDIHTAWCGPCRMMEKNIFTQPQVGAYFNSHFICMQFDAEKEKDNEFFKHYSASAFPTFYWLNADGELTDVKTGFLDADPLVKIAQDAVHSNFAVQSKAYRERWEGGEHTLELVHAYVINILAKTDPDQVKPNLDLYLSTQTDSQMQSKDNYGVLKYYMHIFDKNRASQLLLDNADIYCNYELGTQYWENMYRFIVRSISVNLLNGKTDEYKSKIKILKETKSKYTPMYLKLLQLEALLYSNHFDEGIPAIQKLVDEYSPAHKYLLAQLYYSLIIAHYFDKAPVVDAQVDEVIRLANEIMHYEPCKQNLVYLASSYAKKGDFMQAYHVLASLPYFKDPQLSNALYPYLGIPFVAKEFR